jgi:outer membrane protein assembly factor BamB
MTRLQGALCLAGIALLAAGCSAPVGEAAGRWNQWGGPNQDFRAQSSGLAGAWPEAGPPRLWTRELGEGYSAILVDGDRLYTMYRKGDEEAVICLDASDGTTIWEQRYEHAARDGHVQEFGDGPRSTPLLTGGRVYTIGVGGLMHCLDQQSGKPIWSHDLWDEFGGNVLPHGYSSSPIEYKDTVIALVGGEGQSIVAFDKRDGSVRWKALSYRNSYSTPRILQVDGEDQLVTFMATALIGVDPNNGELRWEYAHENTWNQNINMPVMADPNHLFLSSPEAGARGLKLTRNGATTAVEEVWSTRKIQFYHVSTVRDGDFVYGSTGTRAPAFMAAVNIRTGDIAWRKRGFAKANVVAADGRLIILDEDGKLYLATATPQDLTVHSQVQLLDDVAWTVPTIVGRTLYVRDKQNILALDLGQQQPA